MLFHFHSPACEPRDWAQNRGEFVGEERDPEKASLPWHNIALLPSQSPQNHKAESWDWQCLPCLPFVTDFHLPEKYFPVSAKLTRKKNLEYFAL